MIRISRRCSRTACADSPEVKAPHQMNWDEMKAAKYHYHHASKLVRHSKEPFMRKVFLVDRLLTKRRPKGNLTLDNMM